MPPPTTSRSNGSVRRRSSAGARRANVCTASADEITISAEGQSARAHGYDRASMAAPGAVRIANAPVSFGAFDLAASLSRGRAERGAHAGGARRCRLRRNRARPARLPRRTGDVAGAARRARARARGRLRPDPLSGRAATSSPRWRRRSTSSTRWAARPGRCSRTTAGATGPRTGRGSPRRSRGPPGARGSAATSRPSTTTWARGSRHRRRSSACSTWSTYRCCSTAGHLLAAGGDPLRCLRDWRPRIDHVHVKDVEHRACCTPPPTGREAWRGGVVLRARHR